MMGIRKGVDPSSILEKTEVTNEALDNSISNFPYENRVFVCMGKLKNNRGPYVWIMTISDDYKDVIFWEPKTGAKYELKYRIDDSMRLKNFLEGKYHDYDAVKNNLLNKKIVIQNEDDDENVLDEKKAKKRDFDDKKIPGTGDDDSFVMFQEEFADNVINDEENFGNNYDKIAGVNMCEKGQAKEADKKFDYSKQLGFYDDFVFSKNAENAYKNYNYNFNAEQKEQMDKKLRSDGEQYLLPVDDFQNDGGVHIDNVLLPFETLDIIFNRKNIFANTQFHDPTHIKYNIYQM